ncbi:MAG: hypothetical protein JST68_27310 [Bacteroidetes bacterium]|nr:hypothetical protein [Bacteroidota bacterium]
MRHSLLFAVLLLAGAACKSGGSGKEAVAAPIEVRMLGTWAAIGEPNATFVITKDSIFYPDHNKTYKYVLSHDSMHIQFDDYDGDYLVKMRGKDTLVLMEGEPNVYYRFK